MYRQIKYIVFRQLSFRDSFLYYIVSNPGARGALFLWTFKYTFKFFNDWFNKLAIAEAKLGSGVSKTDEFFLNC